MKNPRMLKKKIFAGFGHFYALLMLAFFYIPVIVMVIYSFNDGKNNNTWGGFTTRWYTELFQDTELWGVFGTTVWIAIVSTILAIIIGTLGAVGLHKCKFSGKGIITNSMYLPIVVPEIVLAIATFIALQTAGFELGPAAMILGNTTLVLPYVYITVKSRLVGMDPSIEEASLDLGANRAYTFLHVILPAVMPGVMSGAFMSFTLVLDDLIVSSFLADATTVTLPMRVYSMLKKGIKPEINALSTVVLAAFLIALLVYGIILFVKERKNKLAYN